MEQFIGCDAHKKFSVFVAVNERGQAGEALRVVHDRELYREFLARLPAHSEIAVEASGSYSWLVDEMERSGHRPKLCNPHEAKRRMGLTNKTDKLDAKGLAILLRNGALPEVWIPPSELRDQRELLRLRIFLVRLRTRVKNRIHAALTRHNLHIPGADLFGVAARRELSSRLSHLPLHSREAVEQELATLDFLNIQIKSAEERLEAIMKVSAEADLLKTLPCVGTILSMIMMLEIGKADRFPTAAHLASYAGLVPRVHSSGGYTRMGQVCGNVILGTFDSLIQPHHVRSCQAPLIERNHVSGFHKGPLQISVRIVDLVGKHGRVRTAPMPTWVKAAVDAWTLPAGVAYLDAAAAHYKRTFAHVFTKIVHVKEGFPRLTRARIPLPIIQARYELDIDGVDAGTVAVRTALDQLGVM